MNKNFIHLFRVIKYGLYFSNFIEKKKKPAFLYQEQNDIPEPSFILTYQILGRTPGGMEGHLQGRWDWHSLALGFW